MEQFNPFAGYIRKPELDQPRLVSGVNRFEEYAIPPQIGFTSPEGTDVQMSYQRARELGLISTLVVATQTIEQYLGK